MPNDVSSEPGFAPGLSRLPAPTTPTEPGIYPALSFDQYAAIPAINFSRLVWMKDTPAHAHYRMTHDSASTPSQRLGYLVHMAILEPQRFAEQALEVPRLDRRTTEGKRRWKEFEEQSTGRELVTAQEMEVCVGIAASVSQNATAREILRGRGASELSIVWRDEEYDVLCKGRLDRVGEIGSWPVILDVKTMGDIASLRNWQRSITNYHYVEQAAMYSEGLHVLRPLQEGSRKFIWLVAETLPPYGVRLFECDYDALQYGHGLYREHLRQYAECVKSGIWPSYPEGIETAGLPPWIQKTFDASL